MYNHWQELGGCKIGGTIIFTKEGVQDAIQRGQTMASNATSQGDQGQNKAVRHKKRSSRMRATGTGPAEKHRIETAERHGLIDDVRKVS